VAKFFACQSGIWDRALCAPAWGADGTPDVPPALHAETASSAAKGAADRINRFKARSL